MQKHTSKRLFMHILLLISLLYLLAACVPIPAPTTTAPSSQSNASPLAQLAQPPARHTVQNDLFYFVMPDRFANGTTTNDTGGQEGDRIITGFDPTHKGFYHGGDIAGLTSKLDYLEQLGITAIWMTPLFKNKVVQGSGADISASYHGYWIVDFTQLDPHFGTNEELETLIQEAHARGIKIFFDIVANHTADVIQYEEGQTSYRSKLEYPYRDANGLAFDDQAYAGTNNFPALNQAQSFPYTPIVPQEERRIKAPAWLNAPIYYHNRGNSQFSGENSLYGDFFGLDDLFTEHPKVLQGMIDIYKDWITNYDIDGFRIDTVKHVNIEFWRAFTAAIMAHAQERGKEDFFIFGEVYSGNEALLSEYTTDADLPGVLDFRIQGNVRNYVSQGGPASALRTLFENDDFFIDEDSNAYSLPTFIGNHDMGRIGHFLQADQSAPLDDAALLARDKLAHAMLYFVRGVPVIYYGDEQGFTGDGGDQDARQDMFPSQVASYNDDMLIGTTATHTDDNFDTTHPLYITLASYAELYQAHTALRTGAQIHRYAADGPGIYAFSRIDRAEQVEYIIAINNSTAATASIPTFYPANTTFTRIYAEGGDTPAQLITDAKGNLPIEVPHMGFVIYQASQPIPPSTTAPQITMTSLAPGDEIALNYQEIDGNQVPQRIEIRAELDTPQFAEVTFAVRKQGSQEFTLIGVDDNPPYRVFYDASNWPDGTSLDFIAIVNDLSNDLQGNYNSALVENITPIYQRPIQADPQAAAYRYAVVHYQNNDGYGDPTTGNFNDYLGLHVWGDGLATGEATAWETPKVFWGEDRYGRFAWVKLIDATQDIGFIVHQGDTKDGTDADRFFNPLVDGPEIWLKAGDPTLYTSQAAAQGYATIHYSHPTGNHDQTNLQLTGEESTRPIDGTSDFGVYWQIPLDDATQPIQFTIVQDDAAEAAQQFIPQDNAELWIKAGDSIPYPQRCAALNTAMLHYHRPANDYGDYTSNDFADFWGLHAWNAAQDPGWQTPYKPNDQDEFGVIFQLDVDPTKELGFIFHQGDNKDPGADQFLNFAKWGCEIWQAQGAEPEAPFILPTPKIADPQITAME